MSEFAISKARRALPMEYRILGRCGLKVPAFSFGSGTFGGVGDIFRLVGQTDVTEATRLIDVCLEAGVNFFDTADFYSHGAAEEILGKALKGRRQQAIISTKSGLPMGAGPNDMGSSRYYLTRAVEASLKRLGTDYIDIYFLHGFDTLTPVEETLRALDDLIRAGKIAYLGASNFSGWQLMKALATSEKYGLARYVVYQGYYSLVAREYEWELMPLGVDQGVGLMVWSPLAWGRLTGKLRRGQPTQAGRIASGGTLGGPSVDDEHLHTVVEALDEVSKETGKTIPQIALNWLLSRPTVSNVVLGASNEQQLKENLGALGWSLTADQTSKLDAASWREPIYPYWLLGFTEARNPKPTKW
jgi:aryl-alcohol dehydrogenase-like predicted oxidoreductase